MDERLLVIPDAVLFTYVKDKEDRRFFIYGDIHQSQSNVCENLSIKDNVEAMAEHYPEVNFDLFLEGGGPTKLLEKARYNDIIEGRENDPLVKMRRYFYDCLEGGCPGNVSHRWLEFRLTIEKTLQRRIVHVLAKDPLAVQAVFDGKFLTHFIHTFPKTPEDPYMKYLTTSLREFSQNFPNKYRMARVACEANVLGRLRYQLSAFGRSRETIEDFIHRLLRDNPGFLAEMYVHTLFDLNFISRVEHVHRDRGEAPRNIFFYGGISHATTLLFYLGLLGVKERYDVGEGLRDYLALKHQDLYQRCHRLEYNLLDLFEGNFPLKDNVEEEFHFLEESPDKYEAIVRVLTMEGGAAVLFQPLFRDAMNWKTETVEKIVERARGMLEV